MKDSLDRVKIESTAKYTRLIVRETTIDDTGDYTLEVKNAQGIAKEVIKIIILGKCFCLFAYVCVSSTSLKRLYNTLVYNITFSTIQISLSRQTWNTHRTDQN